MTGGEGQIKCHWYVTSEELKEDGWMDVLNGLQMDNIGYLPLFVYKSAEREGPICKSTNRICMYV